MQAFNTIEHAVVEVGLGYFAAPSRRGGRRQPTLTSSTLAPVRQKQQLAREMARRRHETRSPLEVEALRASYDEAAKQARTAVKNPQRQRPSNSVPGNKDVGAACPFACSHGSLHCYGRTLSAQTTRDGRNRESYVPDLQRNESPT